MGPSPDFSNTEVAFRYKSNRELARAHFVFRVVNNPFISSVATGLVKAAIALRLPVEWLLRETVFRHFVGGETIENSEVTIDKLGRHGVRTILDYAVEGEKTESGFDLTCEQVLNTFTEAVASSNVPFCVFKVTGIGDAQLLERVQSGQALTDAESAAFNRIRGRVQRICARAGETGIPVLIDAEETWIQDPIDALAEEMMALYNRERTLVYTTIQFYRTDGIARLRETLKRAEAGNYRLGIKAVRGAYMEKERQRAIENGYPDPIQPDKASTDRDFNAAVQFCLQHRDRISLLCGSHNEESNRMLHELMVQEGLASGDTHVWFSQLLGMSDNISFNLAAAGYNVAKYVPFGPVRAVVPYLLRRAEENTSVAGQSSRELQLVRREVARRKAS
ncbi:MAG: proline dehydrogenase family protein [Bacteroidota bacterium]